MAMRYAEFAPRTATSPKITYNMTRKRGPTARTYFFFAGGGLDESGSGISGARKLGPNITKLHCHDELMGRKGASRGETLYFRGEMETASSATQNPEDW